MTPSAYTLLPLTPTLLINKLFLNIILSSVFNKSSAYENKILLDYIDEKLKTDKLELSFMNLLF